MMGISINGPSGIDTAYIIDSLVTLEYRKVTRVEDKKNAYQVKIDAYSKLQTFISDIGKYAGSLKSEDDFNIFTTTSSNEDIVTLNAGTGGVAGNYDVRVFQTAQREKLISDNNLITSQSDKLSDFGITPGKFSINGVEIEVNANDTLQDLRLKINTVTDDDGKKTGVTATVLKIADDNFRIILTSDNTGAEGTEYKDLEGGTFLQDIGIINDADGDKGIATQALRSTADINSAFSALAEGELIEYSGIDHDGNEISNSFLITASSTIDDFLAQIENTFHGMVDVAVSDVDGTLSITDRSAGRSKLAVSSLNMGGTDYSVDVSEIGNTGMNVLSTGENAYFSVDGINMQSETNNAGGFISGITLELHKASIDEVSTIEIERDYDAISQKVQDLLNTYNALVRYVKDSTKFANPDDEESDDGKLAGDMTARAILSQVRSAFQQQFDVTGENKYSTFNMVGLKTDTQTGEYRLDNEVFKDALEESFDDVLSLFITKGYSDNPNIVMGKYSEDTSDGVYTVREVDGDHYEIQRTLPASADWYLSESRLGDIVSFKDGPATGLMLTAPAGSGDATFVFSRGLSGYLSELVDNLTDSKDGTIVMRQQSWNKAQDRCDDRILSLEARVETFRLRLVREFAAMEQTLSLLNSQSASMMSQLGYYTR